MYASVDSKIKKLIQMSSDMKSKAYCPYSRYRVGAALLCEDGTIFTGENKIIKKYT